MLSSPADTEIQDDPEDDIPHAFLRVSWDLFDEDIRDLTAVDKDLAICETNITDWERPATKLIEELKPTQPDADTNEEEENSALPPSCSVSETCQFIDHLKNVALAKINQVMLDSIMKFQDEFFAHRVKCASVQKKISKFFSVE
ncbi:hypothetical protein DPMN_063091 [Dreissena polymorpha]|uniref:Uncharacterized protein n=1 Tax=Dreissena polymorpha TaxID=45954 RepID=A0A9D4CAS6_DREPO|nr:hypothetical protein DPMN_063091 [Dreissena polymorpha]